MTLTPYQLVAPVFSLLAIVYAWNLTLRGKKTIWETTLWTLFWGSIAYIAFYPNSLAYLSTLTGIESHENAVNVTFIGILFFLVFYMVIRLEELEQRVTKLTRTVALKDAGLDGKKGD